MIKLRFREVEDQCIGQMGNQWVWGEPALPLFLPPSGRHFLRRADDPCDPLCSCPYFSRVLGFREVNLVAEGTRQGQFSTTYTILLPFSGIEEKKYREIKNKPWSFLIYHLFVGEF